MDYSFYVEIYQGNSISISDFKRLYQRAKAQLELYRRQYKVTGSIEAECMAICAMADVIYYFEQTPQSLSVGSVSQTERPVSLSHELYRGASTYLNIYRGGLC